MEQTSPPTETPEDSSPKADSKSMPWATPATGPVKKIIAIIYGDSGAGKTFLSGKLENSVLINTEKQGLISLRQAKARVWNAVGDSRGLVDSLRWAWNWLNAHPEVAHVTIDSLTQLQDSSLDKIVGGSDHDTSQQSFGKNYRQVRSLILAFMELPQHLWLIAGERSRETEMGGVELLQPDMQPALLRFVKRQVSLGMHLSFRRESNPAQKGTVTTRRYATTYIDGRAWGIDRSGLLSPTIPDPDLELITRTITGVNNG